MGTWIEMCCISQHIFLDTVVPLVGTWIEIALQEQAAHTEEVVPLVGTWIEISIPSVLMVISPCRPPRGDVD